MTREETRVLIAVDGGGTGCRAAVGTVEAGILAIAQGGPANVSTDFDAGVQNILSAITQAAQQAQLSEEITRAHAHLSLAGVVDSATAAKVSAALPYPNAVVTEDIRGAIAGALGMADGFVVALGTGTIIARQQDREYTRVSGWGFDVSDQGSGAWLGHQILRQTVLCADGMAAHSPLTQEILARFGTQADIMHFATGAAPGKFADFARDVVPAASAGDVHGAALMQGGADYIRDGLAALGFQAGDRLCLSGGVGPHYAPYLAPEITGNLAQPFGSNLDGAFALAKTAAGA